MQQVEHVPAVFGGAVSAVAWSSATQTVAAATPVALFTMAAASSGVWRHTWTDGVVDKVGAGLVWNVWGNSLTQYSPPTAPEHYGTRV